MNILRFLTLFLLTCLFRVGLYAQNAEQEIRSMLLMQQKAWNTGDIPAYMSGYWSSDSLAFISKGKTTYGWKPVLERYQKAYPNQEIMGQLTFSEISIHPVSGNQYFVLGQWYLKRKKGNVGGAFHLLYRKIDGQWLIVMDYTN